MSTGPPETRSARRTSTRSTGKPKNPGRAHRGATCSAASKTSGKSIDELCGVTTSSTVSAAAPTTVASTSSTSTSTTSTTSTLQAEGTSDGGNNGLGGGNGNGNGNGQGNGNGGNGNGHCPSRNPRPLVDSFVVESGASPWHPTRTSHELARYRSSDEIPLIGVVHQAGSDYLYQCVLGETEEVNIWLYTPLLPSERAAIEAAGCRKADELFARYSRRDGRLAIAHNSVGVITVRPSRPRATPRSRSACSSRPCATTCTSSGRTCCSSAGGSRRQRSSPPDPFRPVPSAAE